MLSTPASRFYRPGTALTSRCASTDEYSSGPAAKILPAQDTFGPALPGPTVCRLFPARPQLCPTLAGAPGTAGPDQHPQQSPSIPFAKLPVHTVFGGTAGHCGSHRASPAAPYQFSLPHKGLATEQISVLCVCLLPFLPHNAKRSRLKAAAGTASRYRCPASFLNCSYMPIMVVILCRQSSGPGSASGSSRHKASKRTALSFT